MSVPAPALPQTGFSVRLLLTWSACSSVSPLLSLSASSVLTLKAMSEIIAFFLLVLICGPE